MSSNEYLRGYVSAKASIAADLIAEIRSAWEVEDPDRIRVLSEAAEVLRCIQHELRVLDDNSPSSCCDELSTNMQWAKSPYSALFTGQWMAVRGGQLLCSHASRDELTLCLSKMGVELDTVMFMHFS